MSISRTKKKERKSLSIMKGKRRRREKEKTSERCPNRAKNRRKRKVIGMRTTKKERKSTNKSKT